MPDAIPDAFPDAMPDLARAQEILRACHERRLDREGVPMFLALVDERRPTAPSTSAMVRAEGAVQADLLGRYAELLTPEPYFRQDDEGTLITALQALSYAHFEPSTARGDA